MPTTLKTPRLTLRKHCEADFPAFAAFFMHPLSSRHSIIRYPNLDFCRAVFNDRLTQEHAWVCVLTETGEAIGDIYLSGITAKYLAEIGCILSPEHWGHGYMTEAMNAVLDHAFNDMYLGRVRAVAMQSNAQSISMLERCGFVREATLNEWAYGGFIVDVYYYSLIKPI